MSESLPSRFDVIVVGTGLVESVVAAAVARQGHSVLHLDTAKYYGGDWSAFTWEGLQSWVREAGDEAPNQGEEQAEADIELSEGEQLVKLVTRRTVTNVTETWSTPDEDDSDNDWSREELMRQSRKFNIDLAPRLLFSRGDMVDLLISSNISRYTEFKSVTRVLTMLEGRLEQVPSSRSDVFNTKQISVVEKRILMKFLTQCVQDSAQSPNESDKSFGEYLRKQNLTANLLHYVCHSIAMVSPSVSVSQGLASTRKFLTSLGVFGPTPFLWSMYGTGELPQAFCRLCAVFGGIYFLGKSVSEIVVKDDKKVTGVVIEGKRIECSHLVLPANIRPETGRVSDHVTGLHRDNGEPGTCESTDDNEVRVSRSIFVTRQSILASDKEQLTFLSLPQDTGPPINVIEVGAGACATPKGLQVLHASGAGHLDLELVIKTKKLVSEDSLVYSLSFTQSNNGRNGSTKPESNLWTAAGPAHELDFDHAIQNAREIFNGMFPGEEFLPRAPDPEEISFGDEENAEENACEGKDTEDKDNEAKAVGDH